MAKKYIDADEFEKILEDRIGIIMERYGVDSSEAGIVGGTIKLLSLMPAADVVEVVRCKDCVWRDVEPHDEFTTGCRWYQEERPNDNDYCSYGERKDG